MRAEVDESELPILKVRYPRIGGIEELEEVFATYRRVARENERVAYLLDMRQWSPLGQGAELRKRAAALYAENVDALARSAVCEARVVSNPIVRGVLTAFDWIKGDACWPCRTFTDMDAARRWVEEQLAAR